MARRDKGKVKHFTEGTWSGFPNYLCNYCKFATLNRVEIERHYQAVHAPPPPPPAQPSSLVGPGGRYLTLPPKSAEPPKSDT